MELDRVLSGLLKVSRVIDAINSRIGKWLSWLVLIAVLVSAINATVRKVLDVSSNAWLELQWVLFSAVFLLCSPWTLLSNEHVRIDIVNNLMPRAARNTIELVGHALFLLPLCVIMIVTAYSFMLSSFPSFSDFATVVAQFPDVFYSAPTHWLPNLLAWFGKILRLGEQSFNFGGLPQWPAKSLIVIGFAQLCAQGFSELIKRIAVMRSLIPDPYATQVHPLESEVEQLMHDRDKR